MRRNPAFDFSVESHGSIYLVLPSSQPARAWLQENVQADSQWICGALAVEHRFIGDLLGGMNEAGLRMGGKQ